MAKKGSKSKSKSKSSYKPMSYVKAKNPGAFKGTYKPGTYKSAYADQISGALNTLTNWQYDPMQDARYQALAKIYGARGDLAAKDTLADAAGLNGGYQTSYAVSAAQQARNQYNQELAALIPDLEANAYSMAQSRYNALRDADDTAYGRFRDTQSDLQWQYTQQYNAWRDAMADYQWGKDYDTSLAQYKAAQAEKKKSSGGGGGRRRSGGGGGYSSGYSSTGSGTSTPEKLYTAALDTTYTDKEKEEKKKAGRVAGKPYMYVNFHTKGTK